MKTGVLASPRALEPFWAVKGIFRVDMTMFSFIYRNGILISLLLFGLGVALLWFFILTVVRLEQKNRICSVPLVAEQEVEFTEAGPVILGVEGPFLTTRFGNLSYELQGGDGISMPGRGLWLRTRTTSLKRIVHLKIAAFEIRYPGRYALRIRGLDNPRPDDAHHRIIFTKPHRAQTIGTIVGIVLGGILTIGSLVLFILRCTLKADGP